MKRRILTILAAILVLVVYFMFAWYLMWTPAPLRYNSVDWPEKKWVVKRMIYHGIEGCVWDGQEYYFYRDGQRIRL